MANVGLFTYLRQKVLVSLMRFAATVLFFSKRHRDRVLAKSTFNPTTKTVQIPSRDKSRNIKAILYTPPSPASNNGTATPILVNWHGSGFIMPYLDSDCYFCARVAKEAGIYVLDADYRKAPENRFPAAVEDVEDVMKWIAAQPERFDTERVAVSGFSAGANLALVAGSVLRKSVEVAIQTVISIYPITDLSIAPEAKTVPNPIKPITPGMAHLFNDCYVPDHETRKDPRVSPSYAKIEDYAPTVAMITCEGDILAPEADELAEKLADGKRKVVHRNFKGVGHGFDKGLQEGTMEWNTKEEIYALAIKTLRESLGS